MSPRVPKRYKIGLLGCLLASLGGSEGDPGAPKWYLGCPWDDPGSPKWGLGGSWGALGAPLGDPGVTMVQKVEGYRSFGSSFGLHFWTFLNTF